MATHRTVLSAETDPYAPIVAALMKALASNPVAIAEGSSGAPYIAAGWHPYDGVNIGDGADGVIYDFAVDGAVASVETPNFVDGYEYYITYNGIVPTSGTPDFLVEFYRETSAAYAAPSSIATTITASFAQIGYVGPFAPRVTSNIFLFAKNNETSGSNATFSSTETLAGVRSGTAQKILKARLSVTSSTIGGGIIRMFKRRSYA